MDTSFWLYLLLVRERERERGNVSNFSPVVSELEGLSKGMGEEKAREGYREKSRGKKVMDGAK